MNRHLLARFAESVFWLARYVERAENLARILDVNETFAREAHGGHEWLPVLQMNADEDRFFADGRKLTAKAVVAFYVLDRDNPSSIVASLRMARENARALRHIISTEMWMQLNVFYNEVAALNQRDLALANLSRLCARIKEACQTHAGITEGTFYRDEAWCFYAIGKDLERADQTSRLLDIKYRRLAGAEETPDSAIDVSQWNALLRSVAGYHAFRRSHPRDLSSADVAAFLIHERDFPRSMACCIRQAKVRFEQLETDHDLPFGRRGSGILNRMTRTLRPRQRAQVGRDAARLHAFVDEFQLQLMALTDETGRVYFGHTGA
ncbi:MAG: alpha-E domain-containing protein [Alphaproteobacteria bacterium]|nr:alpha-E domain-containing protein [Alphaproteobacteria bacterium]